MRRERGEDVESSDVEKLHEAAAPGIEAAAPAAKGITSVAGNPISDVVGAEAAAPGEESVAQHPAPEPQWKATAVANRAEALRRRMANTKGQELSLIHI